MDRPLDRIIRTYKENAKKYPKTKITREGKEMIIPAKCKIMEIECRELKDFLTCPISLSMIELLGFN